MLEHVELNCIGMSIGKYGSHTYFHYYENTCASKTNGGRLNTQNLYLFSAKSWTISAVIL